MPAHDSVLEPTRRPLTTHEAKRWMHELLNDNMKKVAEITSHSCKGTCLSYLAKRGASFGDSSILGYHANSMKMVLIYSRDIAARQLALLKHVFGRDQTKGFRP